VLGQIRALFGHAEVFLMYGLTEAFRSTYLPPSEIDRHPGSIGKAVPNALVKVLRPDGSECAPGEKGELVHQGAFVTLGYWNNAELTAQRYRPMPSKLRSVPSTEIAVWSGDIVWRDEQGFLYFVGRVDDMIKTLGHRVSPTEIEEALFKTARVAEAAAIGVPHPDRGDAIVACVCLEPSATLADILQGLRTFLPNFMLPLQVIVYEQGLPKNPNGKVDRAWLKNHHVDLFVPNRT